MKRSPRRFHQANATLLLLLLSTGILGITATQVLAGQEGQDERSASHERHQHGHRQTSIFQPTPPAEGEGT